MVAKMKYYYKIKVKIALLLGLIFITFSSFGQQKDLSSGFTNSFFFQISYPGQLFNACVPTVCLLKLETDSTGHIVDLALSDSADILLKKEFDTNKHKLDIFSLEKQIRTDFGNGIARTTYIIPMSFNIHKTNCPIEKSPNFTGYYTFEGKNFLDRPVRFLPMYESVIKITP